MGAFEQLFGLGRGEFEQKFAKNSNAQGVARGGCWSILLGGMLIDLTGTLLEYFDYKQWTFRKIFSTDSLPTVERLFSLETAYERRNAMLAEAVRHNVDRSYTPTLTWIKLSKHLRCETYSRTVEINSFSDNKGNRNFNTIWAIWTDSYM